MEYQKIINKDLFDEIDNLLIEAGKEMDQREVSIPLAKLIAMLIAVCKGQQIQIDELHDRMDAMTINK